MQDVFFMQSLGFTPDDIQANRSGQLSDRQLSIWAAGRDYLSYAADKTSSMTAVIFVFVMLAIIAGIMIVTGTLTQLVNLLGNLALPAGAAALGLITMVLLYAGHSQSANIEMARMMADPTQDRPVLRILTGRVHVERGIRAPMGRLRLFSRNKYIYHAVIQGDFEKKRIIVNESAQHAFVRGKTYRVYFYEKWGAPTLLSAEPLE